MKTKNTLIYILILPMLSMFIACNFSRNNENNNDEVTERAERAAEVEHDLDISVGDENLMGTIENYDMLGRLYEAARATGVLEELQQNESYTFLAPANIAFERAKDDKIGDLPDSWTQEQLKEVLSSHIVKGNYNSIELLEAANLVAINGTPIKLDDKSHLLYTDIEASNGIVHVIDTLLAYPN